MENFFYNLNFILFWLIVSRNGRKALDLGFLGFLQVDLIVVSLHLEALFASSDLPIKVELFDVSRFFLEI